MGSALTTLKEKFRQLARLEHAVTFLQWDQLVMMPPGGNAARADALSELAAMRHALLTASEMGELLDRAGGEASDDEERRGLTEMKREWRRAVCLPEELVRAKSLAGSTCEHGWRSQRRENDWQGFLGNFREVVNLSRQEAKLRQEAEPQRFGTPYDALLDLYCTGDSGEFIQQVFDRLKGELPQLLDEVLASQPQAAELSGTYSIEQQQAVNEELMRRLGFDFSAGRLDVSDHPFSTGDRGDQRITTRYRETDFLDALASTAHETGHASYEAGLPEKWYQLPVGRARNTSVHESQSLLFEKQLFLSRDFLEFFTPHLHRLLPESRPYDAAAIYHGATRVQRSFIRVEADEVSYPLHVILRFEIERDLMNGVVEPEDIPELWDGKMQRYLGLSTRDNYRDGCLQDIHWSEGGFGYFPSYTLGALNAAQFFTAIRTAHPDWREMLAAGEVDFIRNWLDARVWKTASTMEGQEIMTAATGESTNPRYFLDHIRNRYLF